MTKSLLSKMQTRIETITEQSLAEAKRIIFEGGVVGMPTETVYGLGGNALDDAAVQKIFAVKGRPADNPLIAHVHRDYDLSRLIDYDPPYAKALREAFLPGPLTLVYPSTGKVSRYVSCGLNTLAIRVPAHAGAQALLKEVDLPIAAPSANLSKHVSPTSAQHVYDDFNGKIALILDGGECTGGIESTVCDITGEVPVILRPGLITQEMIAKVVGACEVYTPQLQSGEKVKSPGVLYKHYAPRCQTRLFLAKAVDEAVEYAEECMQKAERVAFLCDSVVGKQILCPAVVLDLGSTPEEMAASLYARLREAEKICDRLIIIEPADRTEKMVGVLNRLHKACASVDVPH